MLDLIRFQIAFTFFTTFGRALYKILPPQWGHLTPGNDSRSAGEISLPHFRFAQKYTIELIYSITNT